MEEKRIIHLPKGIDQKGTILKKSHANRGMNLENDLNITNNYYLENNIAVIHKKPTPIQIVTINNKIITKAYFKEPSTTDYNGLYKGYYLDYDAKETEDGSFPLSNIHNHQLEHLKKIKNQGGISFLIVRFNKYQETYLIMTENILQFKEEKKRRIPYEYFRKKAYKIEFKYNPRLDYLKILDRIIKGELNEK